MRSKLKRYRHFPLPTELKSYGYSRVVAFIKYLIKAVLCYYFVDCVNVVGFLAGVMRRYSKEKQQREGAADEPVGEESVGDMSEVVEEAMVAETDMSRRERKKKELSEIQAILEEEGVLDEMEGKQVC